MRPGQANDDRMVRGTGNLYNERGDLTRRRRASSSGGLEVGPRSKIPHDPVQNVLDAGAGGLTVRVISGVCVLQYNNIMIIL